MVSNFEEDLDKSTFQHGGLYAAATSAEKAKDVGDRCADAALIIAADTVCAAFCMGCHALGARFRLPLYMLSLAHLYRVGTSFTRVGH